MTWIGAIQCLLLLVPKILAKESSVCVLIILVVDDDINWHISSWISSSNTTPDFPVAVAIFSLKIGLIWI